MVPKEIQDLLKQVVNHFEEEDRSVRERQIRQWRKLKLLWDGFQRVWYSEVAHDWRIFDETENQDNQQDYYNKPVNVFRAYLESIIAALSVNVPPIKCYPDDADSPLDLLTAKAGDKIGELISRHNDVSLLWLHALYIYCTEGMVACYNYTKEDDSYGTYEEKEYKDFEEEQVINVCSICGTPTTEDIYHQEEDRFDPGSEDVEMQDIIQHDTEFCPDCLADVVPNITKEKVIITRIIGVTHKPKSRQCMEVYGGLYVKVANYAKTQADTPYLMFAYETNYTFARSRYPKLRDQITPGQGGTEEYARWGRTNPQYTGEQPTDTVTCRNSWLRPCAFEILNEADCKKLKTKYPNGCKVVMINDVFAESQNEKLDDHWTLTNNPLSDYLYFDPIGLLLVSIQEITNDLISLVLQTIEHGIPQTFVDPKVVDLNAYSKQESLPGALYAATPKSGKSVSDAFYEVKTSTLSGEVLPFAVKIQEYGQLVSGALPSLFGGAIAGSGTASEYSMSRAQALQRLQSTWKMFTVWWKTIYSKVIPAYIKTVQEDERIVENRDGNFVNILIRKAELEGKIGSIEIEANENLPMNWAQKRDIIMKLMEANNPQILQMIAQPENLPLIFEAIGIPDFYVPGEDDRNKQYDEIKQLLVSEPIKVPPDELAVMEAIANGMPPPPEVEEPSVEIDPVMDNHEIEFNICRKWAVSEAGQQAKTENFNGYKNVLLHALAHKNEMMLQMAPPDAKGNAPLASPKQNNKAPITEESNVQVQ